jgi:hypothetical protein
MRTRKKSTGDVEQAHLSTGLGHLGNISYRAGNKQLGFNPTTQRTDNPEANKYFTKEYREPWIVPDNV